MRLGDGWSCWSPWPGSPHLPSPQEKRSPASPMAKAMPPSGTSSAPTRRTRTPPNPSTTIGRSSFLAPSRRGRPQLKTSLKFRHGLIVITRRGDVAHALEFCHKRRRGPVRLFSVAKLPIEVPAPRVDPAILAQGEAVVSSGNHAPHPNPGHGNHRSWLKVFGVRITMAHFGTPAALQHPAGHIYKQPLIRARRDGQRAGRTQLANVTVARLTPRNARLAQSLRNARPTPSD
jgi:hypothetical protein